MKPIAYIHIGLEKTGTTTLQEFFHLNKENLAKDNIHFMSSPGTRNHTDLVAYAYDKTLGDLIVQKNLHTSEAKQIFRENFIARFNDEIHITKSTETNLLVSSEHLSSRVFSKDEIRKLLSLFTENGYQPKIIVYLRRQDQYLLSTYSTWLKSGATAELNEKAYKRKRYDYLSLLEMWSEVVGDEHLVVKIFERAKMHDNDLIQDFLKILDIKDNSVYIDPPADLNKSLDSSKLLFLKSINNLVPAVVDGLKNPLRGELIKALEQIKNTSKLSLDTDLSQAILDYYREDNIIIKKKYFASSGGSLFDETIKPKSSEASEEESLSKEKALEISSALWTFQQEEINNLKQLCSELHNTIEELKK